MPLLSFMRSVALKFVQVAAYNVRNLLFAFQDSHARPMVTVVVPLYNEERFVAECLESVRRQNYRNLECIVVNDASTDASRALAMKFAEKDRRFRVVDHAANRGLSASRNTGLRNAAGGYVTFLDADDLLLPNSIWRRVKEFGEQPSAETAGVFCGVVPVQENWRPGRAIWLRILPSQDDMKDFIACGGECPFTAHAPLLKTELVRTFGGFDEGMLHGAEDWNLWLRMLRNGYHFMPSGNFGAVYRQKSSSMVRTKTAAHVEEAVSLIAMAYSHASQETHVPGAPYFYAESLCHYQEVLVRTKRLAGFAAMCFLSGDENGFSRILDKLEPGSLFYAGIHINIVQVVDGAIARYYCIGMDEYQGRQDEFGVDRKHILDALTARMSAAGREGRPSEVDE